MPKFRITYTAPILIVEAPDERTAYNLFEGEFFDEPLPDLITTDMGEHLGDPDVKWIALPDDFFTTLH